jgi:hypothetical protein
MKPYLGVHAEWVGQGIIELPEKFPHVVVYPPGGDPVNFIT